MRVKWSAKGERSSNVENSFVHRLFCCGCSRTHQTVFLGLPLRNDVDGGFRNRHERHAVSTKLLDSIHLFIFFFAHRTRSREFPNTEKRFLIGGESLLHRSGGVFIFAGNSLLTAQLKVRPPMSGTNTHTHTPTLSLSLSLSLFSKSSQFGRLGRDDRALDVEFLARLQLQARRRGGAGPVDLGERRAPLLRRGRALLLDAALVLLVKTGAAGGAFGPGRVQRRLDGRRRRRRGRRRGRRRRGQNGGAEGSVAGRRLHSVSSVKRSTSEIIAELLSKGISSARTYVTDSKAIIWLST